MLGALVVEEAGQGLVVEMFGEPEGDQQRDADLLGRGLAADPFGERAPAGVGDGERAAITGARVARVHEPAGFERLQLASRRGWT